MSIEDYYKAIQALKPPANLDLAAEVLWFDIEVTKLRMNLNKSDLVEALKADKQWQKKVDSSN